MNKEELKKVIESIFETAKDQTEAIVAIYRLALPRWDEIEKVNGWPSVGKGLSDLIWKKCMEFDRAHHPGCIPGSAWMNNGFSTQKDLGPWEINVNTCQIKYNMDVNQ